ncbi:MAG: DUF7715 family protein [Actinomycetota bacterium]
MRANWSSSRRLQCEPGSLDDRCGCRRSMAGIVSYRATTTIKVVHREEINPDTYFMLISDGLRDQGYVTKELLTNREVNDWLRDLTGDLVGMAGAFEVGVLERRGDFVNVRRTLG